MRGFNKLGITLTSIFSLLLLALLTEIFYLLWRRRQLNRKKTRVEPTRPKTTLEPNPGSDFLKLDPVYGPSRVLFTIKEEEREGLETEVEFSSISVEDGKIGGGYFSNFQFQVTGASPEVVVVMGDPDFDSDLPFSTPCASPPYFTPSCSPSRKDSNSPLTGLTRIGHVGFEQTY